MSEISWTVTESSGQVRMEVPKKDKLPFVPALEINDKMPEGQKKFADQYNLMRKTLQDNGLMNKR